jgi:hypothetical protein
VVNSTLRKRKLRNLNYTTFFLKKTKEFNVHVDDTTVPSDSAYGMIMGRYLISELNLILDFDTKSISWDNIDQPMKSQGEFSK